MFFNNYDRYLWLLFVIQWVLVQFANRTCVIACNQAHTCSKFKIDCVGIVAVLVGVAVFFSIIVNIGFIFFASTKHKYNRKYDERFCENLVMKLL